MEDWVADCWVCPLNCISVCNCDEKKKSYMNFSSLYNKMKEEKDSFSHHFYDFIKFLCSN